MYVCACDCQRAESEAGLDDRDGDAGALRLETTDRERQTVSYMWMEPSVTLMLGGWSGSHGRDSSQIGR